MNIFQIALLAGAAYYIYRKHTEPTAKAHPLIPKSNDLITQERTRLMGRVMFDKDEKARQQLWLHDQSNNFVPYGSNT